MADSTPEPVTNALLHWLDVHLGNPTTSGPTRNLWVGYSGGMDSAVLLEALAALRAEFPQPVHLGAIHVDHALHPDSPAWARHCAQRCEQLGVPLTVCRLPAGQLAQEPGGLEAAARRARYEHFLAVLAPGDALLLAHHANDQAETVLLRMAQGRGLLPMPAARPLGPRRDLYRPLLELPRSALRAYAQVRSLSWLEDPANAGTDPDRNYLRHRVLPALEARWEGVVPALGRAGRAAAAERAALSEALAGLDALPVARALAAPGQAALRAWLAGRGEHGVTDRALMAFCAPLERDSDANSTLTLAGGVLEARAGTVRWRPSPAAAEPGVN
ncbi:MAG: tRNA lysidine(34) synthetase TilS [Pseudomonadota bacterium]